LGTDLADTVCYFIASRNLIDGSRSGRKEDELPSRLHERYTGLEESEIAEDLDELDAGSKDCMVVTHVDSPVFLENSKIDFAKRFEPFS
jgi:hypothetical protein